MASYGSRYSLALWPIKQKEPDASFNGSFTANNIVRRASARDADYHLKHLPQESLQMKRLPSQWTLVNVNNHYKKLCHDILPTYLMVIHFHLKKFKLCIQYGQSLRGNVFTAAIFRTQFNSNTFLTKTENFLQASKIVIFIELPLHSFSMLPPRPKIFLSKLFCDNLKQSKQLLSH